MVRQLYHTLIYINQYQRKGDGEIDWTEFLDMTKKRMKMGKSPQTETIKVVEKKEFKPKKVKYNKRVFL